jgi:hypothetical protein
MVQSLEKIYLGALLHEIPGVPKIGLLDIIAMINNMQLLLNYAYSALIKLKANL